MIATTEQEETIALIKGCFNPQDAAEVLFGVLGDKIRFHNVQRLSMQERFNCETGASDARLQELRLAKEDVATLIAKAIETDANIEIKCNIEMVLKP